MSSVWSARGRATSSIQWQGSLIDLAALASEAPSGREQEDCLVVPAQRVLSFSTQSWLRPFSDFTAGDPYVIREFSEHLRVQAEHIFDAQETTWRMNEEAGRLLADSVFGKFQPALQITGSQKELVLAGPRASMPLPYMVWSAGQREFVPLWLALSWLLASGASSRKQRREWVVIEEPEMGLHPKAVAAVLFVILELLHRGYRVCLSTHSTHVLDLIWALRVFRTTKAPPEALLEIFGVRRSEKSLRMAKRVLAKDTSVYYFDDEKRETLDMSSLNLDDDNPKIHTWGKLMEFSGQVGETIAKHVSSAEGR